MYATASPSAAARLTARREAASAGPTSATAATASVLRVPALDTAYAPSATPSATAETTSTDVPGTTTATFFLRLSERIAPPMPLRTSSSADASAAAWPTPASTTSLGGHLGHGREGGDLTDLAGEPRGR